MLTEEKILGHARATSDQLVRLGLAEDPLNKDLWRLFNNFVVVEAPPSVEDLRAKRIEDLRVSLQAQVRAVQPHVERAKEAIGEQVRTMGDTTVKGVITRLAAVDTCLSRWEIEPDASKRVEWLEQANGEITALAKQKADGKLTAYVLGNPDVFAHARDTSARLERFGLADAPLNLGVKRLFNDIAQP